MALLKVQKLATPRPVSVPVQYYSNQGLRSDNEDYENFFLNLDLNGKIIATDKAAANVFVVCDGHGGDRVSTCVGKMLIKSLTKDSTTYPIGRSSIKEKYDLIESKIEGHPDSIGNGCGSTALTVCHFYEKGNPYLQVINLGDCRAVMSRNGLPYVLSKDHKPMWPDEQERIHNLNERLPLHQRRKPLFVEGDWRVNGLSVSRAFGDTECKPHISHLPDSFVYPIGSQDEFIVMGCDGLYDCLDNDEVINFVRNQIKANRTDHYIIPPHKVLGEVGYKIVEYPGKLAHTANIAEKLSAYAIAKGSTDNVSVIIIFLQS
jgi:serine/threonine protein phosphatase PrpC